MPAKRLSPVSDLSDAPEPPLKKTQRTHEENQERAYIAASRRADRDIEHRVRSALKASECRKKRTGRGLKITREAVMGDEQYESEDDDASHPSTARRFSMPASTTASSSLPNPYMLPPTRATADRYAEVDALFAKHFPHVRLSSPRWRSPLRHHHNHSALAYHPRRSLSLHGQTPYVPRYPPPPPLPQSPTQAQTRASPLLTSASRRQGEETKQSPTSPVAGRGEQAFAYPAPTLTTAPAQAQAGAWYHPLGGNNGGAGGWHMRSLSLPVPLLPAEGFAFAFSSSSSLGGTGGLEGVEMGLGLGLGVVEPRVLSTSSPSGALEVGDDDEPAYVVSSGTAEGGGGVSDGISGCVGEGEDGVGGGEGPAEPWTDWVNLDGGGETVGGVLLGVEV
ncbi:hypothetical protein C8A05DRAFT_36033 [Staphylotrichum tortipilum]|uniref:Uncharacterized protein n=1 Tax=Staphylotrichum tortipilum TaxID=2831512 RepID=A0AAN6RRI7_9PEZI|nr:hypothetical protein C8A05DRAFT_36033 [Staphylotrichum longicolle]